jgi:lipopolysaccharide transport system ATP-binding protein
LQTLPSDMKPILEVQNISKKYRIQHLAGGYLSLRERMQSFFRFEKSKAEDFWALKDVSFEVQAGESIGIIGRNGAGKSTLLKILSKITPPTNGKIVTRGRIASLLEVGTGFHPELTGRENIFFNGSLLGMKRIEITAKFDEIVDFSGVEKFLDTPLKHYSSGMQLRLAFAVAAFLEPEILIIDEVLAVGDAEFQKKCLRKMEDVSKSGRTILFVSHNLGAVRDLCDKCILFDSGEIQYNGNVEKATSLYRIPSRNDNNESLFHKPKNSFLWLKSIQINNQATGSMIYFGDALHIQLDCMSDQPMKAFIGFVITSADGSLLLNANNRYQRNDIHFSRGLNKVVCKLGVVPFMEGNYSVNIYLGDESKDKHIVENAITFEVHERDIWGNGKLPPKRVSALWWNTEFEASVEVI